MPLWKHHISKISFPQGRKHYQCTFCRWSQQQCEIWLIQWRAQWVLHHTHRQPWRGKWIFIKCIIRASFQVFRQIKATFFTIFVLEWWPPNTSTMRATRQEEPAPGEYIVPCCSTFVLPHVSRCLPSAPCSLAHKLCCQQTDHSSRQTWNKDSGDILHTWSICF